jgi:hypothetical protein
MSRYLSRALLFVVAGVGAVMPAYADDASTTETIRDRSKEMSDLGVAYGRALGTCINDTAEDKIERAKIAYVEVMLSLHRAITEVPQLTFEDTTKGRALKLTYEKFLKVQNDNCRTLGLDYLVVIQDEDLTSTERRDKVMKIVERQVAIEKPHVEALNAALTDSESKDQ